MTRWEYAILRISVGTKINGELDIMGQGGWELVSVTEDAYVTKFYFKRPLP